MRWKVKAEPQIEIVQQLQNSLGVERTIAKLLVQRGVTTFDEAKSFFRPSLKELHDPFLMQDMEKAVARIEAAITAGENIMVYGDYDVDGTTSVALMSTFLRSLHPNIATYIPDRYNEGYGVSYMGIDFAADNDISLIVALDCGIKAIDKVAYAKEKGVDFIICDHHRPGANIPDAVAVLDPKREDCNYPYKELCGCGVGFKLIEAISYRRGATIESLFPYLDLVAVAVAADIVPVTGENRILAYFGMQVINKNPRVGLQALLKTINREQLTITDVVFTIAPRINAAGRIKHGNHAVELLTEEDPKQAEEFAAAIEENNIERKGLDKAITAEALEQIRTNDEEQHATTVVFDEKWHKGVIGIVASRLTETYYRPTLVFTKSGEKLAASARSVKGFDVYNALEQCSEFIEQFGGHKYAAGLTLLPSQYEDFKNKFEEVVEQTMPEELKTPELAIDAELSLSEVDAKFYRIIKQMGPFGPQNLKPVFASEGLRDNGYGKQVGGDKSHLKLSILDGANPKTYNAIGFGLGNKYDLIKDKGAFKLAYSLDENHWNGTTSIQLMMKDLIPE